MTTPSTSAQGPVALDAVIAAIEDQMPATQDMESTSICDALERAIVAVRALPASPSSAASPASPSGVQVKPLEWEDRELNHPRFRAEAVSGVYYISRTPGGLWKWWTAALRGSIEVKTVDEAKAAAQANFEARILSALASDATPAPTSGSEDGGEDTIAALRHDLWEAKYALAQSQQNAQAWHRVCQAIATVLGLPEPDADFANVVRDWSERALTKPAPEPAGGDVREALLLIRPVIAGLIKAEYNVETWGLKGRLAKIDDALGLTRVCEVCGGDCSAANPPPSYCPERDAALSSSAGPAEPVAYASAEQIAELVIDRPGDGGGAYIPLRKTPAGLFQMALYAHPAPATVEMLNKVRTAYEKARYQPGDHPIIPHKLNTLMKELAAALAPATEGRKG